MLLRNVESVDVTLSLSIRSSALRERVALQFTMPLWGGVAVRLCGFRGYSRILAFSSGQS